MDVIEFLEDLEDPGDLDGAIGVADHVDQVIPNFREIQNPMDLLTDLEFKKRFRFSKDTVQNFILPLIIDDLSSMSERGRPIPPVIKLLTCLRFYATGSFQIVCGDLVGISQSSVSRIVSNVSTLLARLRDRFIKFPSSAVGIQELKDNFKEQGTIGNRPGFRHVIGAIDGCHIPIQRPKDTDNAEPETFRNRKNFFSINVMGTVGPGLQFLDIVARWPGQEHDSRIFNNSRLKLRLETRQLDGQLVGDSGYHSYRYLLTPLVNPTTPGQQRYNACHIRTRNPVERTFGVWKRRFPCLRRTLANAVQTSVAIIVACAVLHNIAILRLDEFVDDEEEADVDMNLVPVNPVPDQAGEGLAVRRDIIAQYFS